MVAFRKLFPVLGVFALFVGASTASAQATGQPLQCTANAGVPPVVRSEGFTELTGDLVVTCTGGNPATPFLANFQVFLNTNITSRLLTAAGAEVSEALLMVDEPGLPRTAIGGGTGTPTPFCISPGPASNSFSSVPGAAGAPPACNPATAGATYQTGSYTVFRGTRQVGNPENIVTWQGIPVTPPGTNIRTFRITNIRANAAGLGASQTLIPTQIVAYLSVFPQGTLPIDNPQQVVGFVQQGMLFDVRNCTNTGGASATSQVQCRSVSQDVFNNPTTGTLPSNNAPSSTVLGLRFREGFQTAFKPRLVTGQDGALPGQVFNSESGFVRTAPDPAGTTLASVGQADFGTRLAARFTNVPANVRIFVGTTQAPVSTGGTQAFLVGTGDPAGVVAGPVAGNVTIQCAVGMSTPGVEVPITAGSGVAVWEVSASNPAANEDLLFYMAYAYRANQAQGQPALGTAQVIGNFAPFYAATGTPGAGSASAALPIPRFVARTDANNLFTINVCQTSLLFPFVTNQAGFDTGIAISNTSADPFPSPNDRLNTGRCTLNYFGRLANGNAPTTTRQQTDREVTTDLPLTMVLSTGGNYGLTGNATFQGYIIATCDFLYAHGFAFVTDGPIGQARVAEGYLALVIDGATPNNLRGNPLAENLGN